MLDKTFEPAAVEARRYREWERSGGFAADPTSPKPPYTIMMPPPNVTGSLHMGHALTFTLQDVLIRYHRMRGYDALWQPGTDHAGIATEIVVTNQLAESQVNKLRLGRAGFIARVWAWKEESGGTITRQLRRLGASPDWGRERFTMDAGLSAAVRRVFVALYRKGLVYRDKRLVNWDPEMHTVISDLEVDSRETRGRLWHIRYPLADSPGRFIIVATTRPETMLGDTAVAVHPEDSRFADLVGKTVRLPLADRLIPIVADAHADPKTGSGAVKITPAHDFADFEVGRRHNLPLINIFDKNARIKSSIFDDFSWGHRAPVGNVTHADEDGLLGRAIVEEIPEAYHGLDRFDARKKIVADLEALGLIDKVEEHTLMVPHADRSGAVIEPFLTDQWFCDAKTLAAAAIAAVESGETRFVPRQWENTFFEWMRNIQPWCISRQLWWGHQIPAWYAPDGAVFVAETEEEAQREAAARYGEGVVLSRDEDVLDTWFSSALWPFSTLGWPEKTRELERYYPTDVLVTGFDIIFFWVARMMMMGLHFIGAVPFRTVYIHALVRDARGQKMSKSRGNIIDPLELIDRYGCDALRFTLLALAAPGRDIKLAESRVEGYRNFATKLWNAARYAEINDCAPVAEFRPQDCRLTVNRWIAGALAECAAAVAAALDAYRFDEAASRLYQFVWGTFCDWYLEFSKPILSGTDAAAGAETRAATAWVLGHVVHLLHPIMPFVTEEVWEHLAGAGAGLLMTGRWPDFPQGLADPAASAEMEWVVAAISAIRAVRAEMNVPPAARVPLLVKDAEPAVLDRLARHREHFLRLARVEEITAVDTVPAGAIQTVVEGATLILSLGGVVDLAREKARLGKEIARLDGEIGKLAQKLANPGFLQKARPEIVEEQREREAEAQGERARLKAAFDRIAAG
ncbi:MAG TPA: valine--tRNA ligase [Stellaceae bacterium]|nr:valine--tRNA ligase [Stellaceae bacterium]